MWKRRHGWRLLRQASEMHLLGRQDTDRVQGEIGCKEGGEGKEEVAEGRGGEERGEGGGSGGGRGGGEEDERGGEGSRGEGIFTYDTVEPCVDEQELSKKLVRQLDYLQFIPRCV
eukprot:764419-Hanusia_phi.AAC.3